MRETLKILVKVFLDINSRGGIRCICVWTDKEVYLAYKISSILWAERDRRDCRVSLLTNILIDFHLKEVWSIRPIIVEDNKNLIKNVHFKGGMTHIWEKKVSRGLEKNVRGPFGTFKMVHIVNFVSDMIRD